MELVQGMQNKRELILLRAKYEKDISSDANILEDKNVTVQSINDLTR
jgi:hypothetical protein